MDATVSKQESVCIALDYPVLDSDQHMVEPLTLWQERVDRKFRDAAPRRVLEHNGAKGEFLVFGQEVIRTLSGKTMTRDGGANPAARIQDMEIDGVAAAVLYPTYGLTLFGCSDSALQTACNAAYNDWLAEFCAYDPNRFAGIGMISLYDIDAAVKELERCRKIGLKGVMVWSDPPPELGGYSDPRYFPFWAAAEATDTPVIFHIGTGPNARAAHKPAVEHNWAARYTAMVMSIQPLQETICQLVFGGVIDRFPAIKFCLCEADVAWIPGLMARADKYYASRFRRNHGIDLKQDPSVSIRNNFWHSFIEDPIGPKLYPHADLADRIMWATDYPHPASFFPDSLGVIARDFAGMPELDKRKLLHDNVKGLFGFPF